MTRALLVLFVLLSACGPDAFAVAMRIQSVGNLAAMEIVSESVTQVDARADATEAACTDEACVLAADQQFRPVSAQLALVRELVLDWNAAIARGTAAGPGDDEGLSVLHMVLSFAARFARSWPNIVTAAHDGLHLDLPALPPLVQATLPGALDIINSTIPAN